jgi:predicted dehydrogenase
VGVIGVGGMARTHLRNLVKEPDVNVAALCDVFGPNLDQASAIAPDAGTYVDLRAVLDRSDIDAVVLGTPDHWHAWPTVTACQSGKDVYVEKPTSVTVREGRKMVEAARTHNRIVQVGTQQRAADLYRRVVEIVQSGQLGRITWVQTWNASNSDPAGNGHPPDENPPSELNWDLWLGPAPSRPYNVNRFRHFRRFWDYAGGMMTDWGVHHLDIVFWAMGQVHPISVSSSGGIFHFDDNRETPDTQLTTYEYPDYLVTYECRYNSLQAPLGKSYGILFYGTAASLFVDRDELRVLPEKDSGIEPFSEKGNGNAHREHMRNFLDCVKSRQTPICDIETGHDSSAIAMLGNIAYRTGRRILWDGPSERIPNDSEADALLDFTYRAPWEI